MGYHQVLWIEINENKLLGFWKYDIIPPMVQKSCLEYPRTINIFNDTIHKNLLNMTYIYVQASYPLLTHLEQAFENWMN